MTKAQIPSRLAGAALLGAFGVAATTAGAGAAPKHSGTKAHARVAPRHARRADHARRHGRRRAHRRAAAPTMTSSVAGVVRHAFDGTANAVAGDLSLSVRRLRWNGGSPPAPAPAPAPASTTPSSGSASPAPTPTATTVAPTTSSSPSSTSGSTTTSSAPAPAGSSGGGSTSSAASSSGTEPAAPSGFSSGQLIFNDTFSGSSLDTSKWNPYMTSKAANGYPWNAGSNNGSSLGSTYLDYDSPSQLHTGSGLTIDANQGSTQSGFSWTSGVVTSYNHFQFDGGYLQVRAKMPTADGDWPAVWMLPGPGANTSTDNFEIDLFEGGMTGGSSASTIDSYHVHNGSPQWGGNYNTGVDLSSGYHTYGLDWVPGQSITWYFDGKQIAQVTSAQFPIPNEPMELIINNGMANSSTSGWHTQVDGSTGSSSVMQVSSVQVYQ